MRLFRQLVGVFIVLGILLGIVLLFSYDIIKIDWISFMEIQPSYRPMENPLPPPANSIPVEGPVFVAGLGAPTNPTLADDGSLTRGAELYRLNCLMCHGPEGQGNGAIAAFLANKPANLKSDLVQSKSDGSIFLTISNGVTGRMPPLNENLTVPERWDVVNYVRTLKVAPSP